MSSYPNPYRYGPATPPPLSYGVRVDAGAIARFFNIVYAWMSAGLAITAGTAYLVSRSEGVSEWVRRPGILIGLIIAQLALVVVISMATRRIGPGLATLLFVLYAVANGLTLSIIFIAYTGSSIAGAFGVTAGMFAATSVYGMVTKRDLTRLGSFLFMALIGLVLASVVNIFLANSTVYWITTYAGVLIFVGLTAFDTQKLKHTALATAHDPRLFGRLAITGALILYLDFLNLFLYMLRILGKGRN